MNTEQVKAAIELLSAGNILPESILRPLADNAILGCLTAELARRPTAIQPALRQLQGVARGLAQGMNYA